MAYDLTSDKLPMTNDEAQGLIRSMIAALTPDESNDEWDARMVAEFAEDDSFDFGANVGE